VTCSYSRPDKKQPITIGGQVASRNLTRHQLLLISRCHIEPPDAIGLTGRAVDKPMVTQVQSEKGLHRQVLLEPIEQIEFRDSVAMPALPSDIYRLSVRRPGRHASELQVEFLAQR